MTVLSALVGVALFAVGRADEENINFETIVTEGSYSKKGCKPDDLIFEIPYTMHANECKKFENPDRYEMAVCTDQGLLEELVYGPEDDKCEGEIVDKFSGLKHGACHKTEQFGETLWRKVTLKGHCQGFKMCDRWVCEHKEWEVIDHKMGEHPRCQPMGATKQNCQSKFMGRWVDGKCAPPEPEDSEDSCAGYWELSHEGSRQKRCMYPEAICAGCGFKSKGKGKMKCAECMVSKKKVAFSMEAMDEAACDCSAACKGAVAWQLKLPKEKKNKKRGSSASCVCYASKEGGEPAVVIQKGFSLAGMWDSVKVISSSDAKKIQED